MSLGKAYTVLRDVEIVPVAIWDHSQQWKKSHKCRSSKQKWDNYLDKSGRFGSGEGSYSSSKLVRIRFWHPIRQLSVH